MMADVTRRISNTEQGMLNSEGFVAPFTETFSYNTNKNITDIIDVTGTLTAHYEYSPFGQITSATGSLKDDFEYRFSSEYFDPETTFIYYNFRYYNPQLARWLSRDPIGEKGGLNLYVMVENDGVNKWDRDGLKGKKDCCCCCVDKLDIKNIVKLNNLPMYGHSFDIVIEMSYKKVEFKNRGTCKLTWREKINIWPNFLINAGAVNGQWANITSIYYQTPVFDPWRNRARPCPGKNTITLTDIPQYNTNINNPRKRVLKWEIIVESSKNCQCTHNKLVVKATQTLEHNAQNIVITQDLK